MKSKSQSQSSKEIAPAKPTKKIGFWGGLMKKAGGGIDHYHGRFFGKKKTAYSAEQQKQAQE